MEDGKVGAINRRNFLTITTAAVGAYGIGISAIPFIKAMSPTKDILAAGMERDQKKAFGIKLE